MSQPGWSCCWTRPSRPGRTRSTGSPPPWCPSCRSWRWRRPGPRRNMPETRQKPRSRTVFWDESRHWKEQKGPQSWVFSIEPSNCHLIIWIHNFDTHMEGSTSCFWPKIVKDGPNNWRHAFFILFPGTEQRCNHPKKCILKIYTHTHTYIYYIYIPITLSVFNYKTY